VSKAVNPETTKLFLNREEVRLGEGRSIGTEEEGRQTSLKGKTTDELIRFPIRLQTWEHAPMTRTALRNESQSVLEGGIHLPEAQSVQLCD
jgi:hypothetical protein